MSEIKEAFFYVEYDEPGMYESPRDWGPQGIMWLGLDRNQCFKTCGAGELDEELDQLYNDEVELLAVAVNYALLGTKNAVGYVPESLDEYLSDNDAYIRHDGNLGFYTTPQSEMYCEEVATNISYLKAKNVWKARVEKRAKEVLFWEFIYETTDGVTASASEFCKVSNDDAKGIIFVGKEDAIKEYGSEEEAAKMISKNLENEVRMFSNWWYGNVVSIYFNHNGKMSCTRDGFDEYLTYYGDPYDFEKELREEVAAFRDADVITIRHQYEGALPDDIFEITCPLKHECDKFKEAVEEECQNQ